jgi:hypothetical protein
MMPALLLLGVPLVAVTVGNLWRDVTGQNNSGGINLPMLLLIGGGAYFLLKKGR